MSDFFFLLYFIRNWHLIYSFNCGCDQENSDSVSQICSLLSWHLADLNCITAWMDTLPLYDYNLSKANELVNGYIIYAFFFSFFFEREFIGIYHPMDLCSFNGFEFDQTVSNIMERWILWVQIYQLAVFYVREGGAPSIFYFLYCTLKWQP